MNIEKKNQRQKKNSARNSVVFRIQSLILSLKKFIVRNSYLNSYRTEILPHIYKYVKNVWELIPQSPEGSLLFFCFIYRFLQKTYSKHLNPNTFITLDTYSNQTHSSSKQKQFSFFGTHSLPLFLLLIKNKVKFTKKVDNQEVIKRD